MYYKAKRAKNFVLPVIVGFILFYTACSVLSDGNMVGVQVGDWVVMFSKTDASIVLGEFSITGVGTYETIVTDLDPLKSYDAYFGGDKLDPSSVSNGNGLAKFPLDLPWPEESHLVHVLDTSYASPPGIGILAASISGDSTWAAGTHLAADDILVEEGVTLTVEAGAIVKFAPGVQMEVRGTLVVNGADTNNAIFTSVFDDDYGDDLDGPELTYPEQDPASGDWKGIFLDGMEFGPFDYEGIGQFNYCRITYGGNTSGDADANVYFFSSDLDNYFTNSISEYSANYGVQVDGCSPTFRDSRIAKSNSDGIYIAGTADPDLGTNTNNANWGYNSFRDNGVVSGYELNNTTGQQISAVGNYWGTGGISGPVDNSHTLSSDPTMVVLSSFAAAIRDGKVILSWRTEVEIDNVGFAIYRGDTKDGNYTRIAFVPGAEDSETSNDYRFTDEQVQLGHTYYYYLKDVDVAGKSAKSDVIEVKMSAFPTQTGLEILPSQNALLDNYPNPSNPETWIPYNLAEAADVTIRIYDIRGRLIRTLHLGHKSAGFYLGKDKAAYWDGRDRTGERVGSGIYFYRLSAGSFSAVRKMVILR